MMWRRLLLFEVGPPSGDWQWRETWLFIPYEQNWRGHFIDGDDLLHEEGPRVMTIEEMHDEVMLDLRMDEAWGKHPVHERP